MYRRGGNLPPATFRIQPVWLNDTTPRHVIPSERSESRNPLKQQILPYIGIFLLRGGFLHSAYATVGMTYRGVIPLTRTGYICHGASPWRGWSGDESSPLHRSVYGVIPFTHTGCNCHVAGGRLPMELWCDCPRQSIDFDSLREAPPLHTLTNGPE